MARANIYISHASALHYWRTNPPQYVLTDGASRNIRVLKRCASSDKEIREFYLSEAEFGPRPIDVLVPPKWPRPRSFLQYHVQKEQLPPHALYPLRDGIHIVSPELCFVQLCKTLSFAAAAALGMELCGTYALRPDGIENRASRNYRLASAESLRHKTMQWKNIAGLTTARTVAQYLTNGSASPMETIVFLLLCLPQHYGGYGIKPPELNAEHMLEEEGRLILRQEKVKPDFLWRDYMLVIEYDGDYHNDPMQRIRDEKRRVLLESAGFTVIALKKQQVYDPLAFNNVAKMVASKTGKRPCPLSSKQQVARENLRNALLG